MGVAGWFCCVATVLLVVVVLVDDVVTVGCDYWLHADPFDDVGKVSSSVSVSQVWFPAFYVLTKSALTREFHCWSRERAFAFSIMTHPNSHATLDKMRMNDGLLGTEHRRHAAISYPK